MESQATLPPGSNPIFKHAISLRGVFFSSSWNSLCLSRNSVFMGLYCVCKYPPLIPLLSNLRLILIPLF